MVLTLGVFVVVCLVLTMERQFKEKLNSIKTVGVLVHCCFKYQHVQHGDIVGSDNPVWGYTLLCVSVRACVCTERWRGASLFQKLDCYFHFFQGLYSVPNPPKIRVGKRFKFKRHDNTGFSGCVLLC